MILYDYECLTCGEVFEELVKNRDQEVPCIACGSKTRRKFPLPALRTLNTKEKVHDALKKRSLEDSKRRKDEYMHNAKKQIEKATGIKK